MIRVTDKQYFIDPYLKSNLDTLIYNLKRDFDAVLLISGGGMTRVGKTMLAEQIGYYCAHNLGTSFNIDNMVFSGEELTTAATKFPKNSVIIYDEARAEMNNKMLMETVSKSLLSFFAECGMYNHMLILIMPDYFEMPKSIAINRSEALINVIRSNSEAKDEKGNDVIKFERGVFEFYGRRAKKLLYIIGKKDFDNYEVGKKLRNFFGGFPNTWILPRDAYDAKKLKHVGRDRYQEKENHKFSIALKLLTKHYSQRELADKLSAYGLQISHPRISQLTSSTKGIEV